MIYFWKQHGFIDVCLVLKRDKFHGLAVFGPNCLAGDLPPDGGDLFPNPGVNIPRANIIKAFQLVAI